MTSSPIFLLEIQDLTAGGQGFDNEGNQVLKPVYLARYKPMSYLSSSP
jgi:hypothetical protein